MATARLRQARVNAVTGQPPDAYMRGSDIVRYHRAGQEAPRWTLHSAWIKMPEYRDLEGGNTENSIEKLTICYQ